MKKIVFFLPLIFTLTLQAQNIGINANGSTPDNSAMLDVQSSNKGLLIPRVSLTSATDAATIPNPAVSLLVFNTNAALATGTGFYFNSGTALSPQWTKLLAGTENLWREQTNYVELLPNKYLYIPNNAGIGTVAPAERLHVADGNVKIGNAVWTSGNDRMLKFGDGDYVRLGEAEEDDAMLMFAKYFWVRASSTYPGNVGIGTIAAPTSKLEVNGKVKITDGSQGAGKVLTSDANGLATWTAPAGSSAFRARNFSSQFIPVNATQQLSTTLEDYDPNLNFFSSAFTAPASGVYHFDVKADIFISNTANYDYDYLRLRLHKNGVLYEENIYRMMINSVSFNHTLTLNTNVYLAAGDVITIYYRGSGSSSSGGATADNIIFSGFRIY